MSFRSSRSRFRQRRISLRLRLARPGIQEFQKRWIPASAGMTGKKVVNNSTHCSVRTLESPQPTKLSCRGTDNQAMSAKVFVTQPISEAALSRLREAAEVE